MSYLKDYILPKGWIWTTLGEICLISSGGTPDRKKSEYYNGSTAWVKSGELNYNIITKTEEYISETAIENSSAKILPKDTLLIALYGATVGRMAILGIEATTNQAVGAIICTKSVLNKYLFYYLIQNKEILLQQRKGGAQLNISLKILNDFKLPLPTYQEQAEIVKKIEELFSEIEYGEVTFKKVQRKLKVYRQVLLNSAFKGDLTLEWRNKNEPEVAIKLLEKIHLERQERYEQEILEWENEMQDWITNKNYRKPLKPKKLKVSEISTNENVSLPILPKGWVYTKIANISTVGTGGTPLKNRTEFYLNGTVPWVTSGALNEWNVTTPSDYITEEAVKENNLKIYPKHTLLVALYGEGKTRGKCSELMFDSSINQAIAAILQKESEQDLRDYLKWFLLKNYTEIRELASGGAQPNLNLSIIEDTIVPIPPLKEVEIIVEKIEFQISIVDNLDKSIVKILNESGLLRQTILKKAFEGKLIIRNLDNLEDTDLIKNIKIEKEEYLLKQKENLPPPNSKKKMKQNDQTILEILKNSKGPISAKTVWEQSQFKDDIEKFYAELKKIESQIKEVDKGFISLKDEN